MPKWSDEAGKPMTLEQWINWSRTEHQGAEPWGWESQQMLGMTALIALQSRGMPVDVQTDGPMEAWWKRGEEMYYTRTGQLDFSCASCHEENNGRMLRADHLSQGHTNGFPVYRLKWQGLGSIHRRLEGCVKDTRAETYPRGSDEFVALELYVAWRGEGLDVEAPAVRN
jgi:sulfur-oxidizing protein SoxA